MIEANLIKNLTYLMGNGPRRCLSSNLEFMFSYLDAGTGSMIITAIAGGVAGVGVAFKMGMARFRSKLTGKSAPDHDSSTDDESCSSHD
jgi:hypothetical protein